MYRAFTRTPAGTISLLKPLSGDDNSYARGVTKKTVIGESYNSTIDRSIAVKWGSNGTITDLVGTSPASVATAINSLGQIVGYGPGAQPWVWYQGNVTYLPTLNGDLSIAWAINDGGFITGGTLPNNLCVALWSVATPATPPQNIGCIGSNGMMISNDNWIVAGGTTFGCVWGPACNTLIVPDPSCSPTKVEALLDASGAGWQIGKITGINDSHQMVGWGLTPSYQRHAFLLTPNNLPLCQPT
jgi:hypothetical protein